MSEQLATQWAFMLKKVGGKFTHHLALCFVAHRCHIAAHNLLYILRLCPFAGCNKLQTGHAVIAEDVAAGFHVTFKLWWYVHAPKVLTPTIDATLQTRTH